MSAKIIINDEKEARLMKQNKSCGLLLPFGGLFPDAVSGWRVGGRENSCGGLFWRIGVTENRGRAEAAGAWVARGEKVRRFAGNGVFCGKDGVALEKQRDFSGVKTGFFKGGSSFLRGGKGWREGLEMLKVKRQGDFFRLGAV